MPVRTDKDSRYRGIAEHKIREHFRVERQLRDQILDSSPEERPYVFNRAYSELFDRVPWHPALKEIEGECDQFGLKTRTGNFVPLLGDPDQEVLELGFGTGELLLGLSEVGFKCTGIDVEPMRVEKLRKTGGGRIRVIHGDATFPEVGDRRFDVVISQQLFEHFHPDDARGHLAAVRDTLHPGGTYFLETPNRLTGPHDVSRFFVDGPAQGFHLREYSVGDMLGFLKKADYSMVEVVLWKRRRLRSSTAWILEKMWSLLPIAIRRRHTMGLHNPIYVARVS